VFPGWTPSHAATLVIPPVLNNYLMDLKRKEE